MARGASRVPFLGTNTRGRFHDPKQARLSIQHNPSNTPSNVNPPPKNHNAPPHIINSVINSYYKYTSSKKQLKESKLVQAYFEQWTSGFAIKWLLQSNFEIFCGDIHHKNKLSGAGVTGEVDQK